MLCADSWCRAPFQLKTAGSCSRCPTISIMEAFNRVRNEQSLAHDNKVLGYDESLLILGHVTSSIRFIEAVERRGSAESSAPTSACDDIPF